jgi:hypothetical protein
MTTENQIGTLEQMTTESFEKRPLQAPEAIEEYLKNLLEESEEKTRALEKKLGFKIGDVEAYLENLLIECETKFGLKIENTEKLRELLHSGGLPADISKLKGNKYFEQYKVAITHTSLMIFLMSIKAANIASQSGNSGANEVQEMISQIQIDFDKYVREFLLFARQDDKDVYDMRLFYLNGLTGSELGLDQIDDDMYDSKDERDAAKKKAKVQMAKYDDLLNALRKQYTETKIHLQ